MISRLLSLSLAAAVSAGTGLLVHSAAPRAAPSWKRSSWLNSEWSGRIEALLRE